MIIGFIAKRFSGFVFLGYSAVEAFPISKHKTPARASKTNVWKATCFHLIVCSSLGRDGDASHMTKIELTLAPAACKLMFFRLKSSFKHKKLFF